MTGQERPKPSDPRTGSMQLLPVSSFHVPQPLAAVRYGAISYSADEEARRSGHPWKTVLDVRGVSPRHAIDLMREQLAVLEAQVAAIEQTAQKGGSPW